MECLHETAEYFNEGMGNKWFTNDFDEIDSMSITQNLSFARNRRRLAKDFNVYRKYNSTWMRFMNG